MSDDDSLQKQKCQYYNSPSKKAFDTPIKTLFRKTNYNVGAFIEKFEELNRIQNKIKDVDLKKKSLDGKENKHQNDL